MCLEVKKTEEGKLPVKIADKDIRCMKVLEVDEYGYRTPYRYKRVHQDIVSGKEDFVADRNLPGDYDEETFTDMYYKEYADISAGAVHTYAYTEESDKAIRSEVAFLRRLYCPRATVVFECMIPKGTEYMEGVYEKHKCYGSKSIRFVKELIRFDGGPGISDPSDRDIIYDRFEENADLFREMIPAICKGTRPGDL
jgi:hypothetical protein